MSEKRFEYDRCTGIKDLSIDENDDQFLYPTQIVDLLNEQQIEITELRRAIDYLKTVIRYTIPNQMVADVFKYIGEDYE